MVVRTVRCPHCGKFRKTNALKNVKCFFCGKSFDVKKHIVSEAFYLRQMDKEVEFK
jgi:sarcosine oxidase delta subunit